MIGKDNVDVMSNDASILLGHVLNEYFSCNIIDCKGSGNTFYCDFEYENPISTKDFESIINFMFSSIKNELSLAKVGNKLLADKYIGLGSHDSFNHIGEHFTLTIVSGLHSDKPAQRICGVLYTTPEGLAEYYKQEEEAREYDHRILGGKLGLFRTDPEVMPGMITWLPNGVKVLEKMKVFIRSIMKEYGYNEVITPPFADVSLWKKSGHWDMYKENMFGIELNRDSENACYALKPMNCPLHIEIFKYLSLSYKDLPYKISEFGFCNRYESSGSLHGLFRARGFTQDDAHVFCTEDQIEQVILNFCRILRKIYSRFGFNEIEVCLSTRPEKFAGNIDTWDIAERALEAAAAKSELDCTKNEGDGAFYGPKLDFYIKDSRKRTWQCGTVQLDFVLPERLNASYVDSTNERRTPVMIHHAVLGSLERFIGVLVEHTKGRLPFWLCPTQVVILPINPAFADYATNIHRQLTQRGFEVIIDMKEDTISYRIRKWWTEMHIPVICIVGKAEMDSNTVSLRINGSESVNKLSINEVFHKLDEMGAN